MTNKDNEPFKIDQEIMYIHRAMSRISQTKFLLDTCNGIVVFAAHLRNDQEMLSTSRIEKFIMRILVILLVLAEQIRRSLYRLTATELVNSDNLVGSMTLHSSTHRSIYLPLIHVAESAEAWLKRALDDSGVIATSIEQYHFVNLSEIHDATILQQSGRQKRTVVFLRKESWMMEARAMIKELELIDTTRIVTREVPTQSRFSRGLIPYTATCANSVPPPMSSLETLHACVPSIIDIATQLSEYSQARTSDDPEIAAIFESHARGLRNLARSVKARDDKRGNHENSKTVHCRSLPAKRRTQLSLHQELNTRSINRPSPESIDFEDEIRLTHSSGNLYLLEENAYTRM